MLTLTRREGESVTVGELHGHHVVVKVAKIEGNKVRLSFDAPRDVPIVRSELSREVEELVESVVQI